MAIASFRAGEAIATGDAVYVGASGFLYKASGAGTTEASVVGLAVDNGTSGSLIRVNVDGVFEGLSGLTPGESSYVSITSPGSIVDYSTWLSELSVINVDGYLTNIGRAVTSTKLSVEVSPPVYVVNPTSVLLLEEDSGLLINAILLEDGSQIDLETASV